MTSPRVRWKPTDPKTHSFRGRRFKIKVRRMRGRDGEASPPGWPYKDRDIGLHRSLRTVDFLETLIHEGIHACFPDLKEDAVLEAGRDLARFVARFGFERDNE